MDPSDRQRAVSSPSPSPLVVRIAALLLAVCAVLATFAGRAIAEDRALVRFEWTSELSPPCPDEASFRELVAARLGWEPLVSEAERVMVVRFARASRLGARVRVTLRAASGEVIGQRQIDGRIATCGELAESAALAVAAAIDPLGGLRPSPVDTPEPAEAQPEPTPEPEASPAEIDVPAPTSAPEPEAPPPPLHLELSIDATVRAWIAPNPAFGARSRLTLRGELWSVHLGGSFGTTVDDFVNELGDRVGASFVGGLVGGCGRLDIALACASVLVGAYQSFAATVARPSTQSSLYAEAQLELGVEWLFTDLVGIRASGIVAIPLTRVELAIDATPVYVMPPASAGLQLGVFARFL
jgi:hypothetical protein